MRKRRIVAWSLLIALCAAQTGVVPAFAGDDARIRVYQEQLDRMQKEMDDMRARLRTLEAERGTPGRASKGAAAPAPPAAVPGEASPAGAATTAGTAAEQDRKIGVLATEVERLKRALVLPEHKELKSVYGLGPAASKVYQVDRGLSIGGYGEYNFQKYVSDQQGKKDKFDLLRFVLYTGYKFTDRILMNAEIEFEHALVGEDTVTSDSGAVEVEFAYLDFMLWQQLNVRAGLLLVPMGFINEVHEPPFFHGVLRPEVERSIIPTTWREGGIGFFGTLAPGLEYRAYLMNSLNAAGYESSGIRDGRQSGNRALAEDLAGTMRLDYTPFAGTLVGASFFAGNTGQNGEFDGDKPNAFTLLWETHAQVRYRGLELRALGAMTSIADADTLSRAAEETIAEDIFGFYAEAAYDVLPLVLPDTTQYLSPFFRYEIYDTQDKVPHGFARVAGNDVQLYTVGLDYKPHPQVVLKLEYRNFNAGGGKPRADEVNLGAGFVF
ncbi:MAG: hypothetical protein IT294_11735 [Deltaproteobacteria bacterium]|nr:hypothetical protein [Deltaproteobacteria bacterium]